MKLFEFFSRPLDISTNQKNRENQTHVKDDDVFWYILDHDRIFKEYFFPLAKKLKGEKNCTPEEVIEMFMPMVKKGCKEFYAENKMKGKLGKVFPKELREEICQRLYDHYKEGVQKDEYKIG